MGPLLKIRNRETGEVADLSRDVCVTHPEWVHEHGKRPTTLSDYWAVLRISTSK
jgi:hypothetical protein